jgi:hypothetical protein
MIYIRSGLMQPWNKERSVTASKSAGSFGEGEDTLITHLRGIIRMLLNVDFKQAWFWLMKYN